MLSYRHAFHAGNHADVLKHAVLVEVLAYYNQKDKPYWYVDTHAGAGCYGLEGGYAAKNGEFLEGVGRLWDAPPRAGVLQAYLDVVRGFNPGGALALYPGSPAVALECMREGDRMRLFELHSSDEPLLAALFAHETARVQIRREDGFKGLIGLLPPPSRRAVVLMDPPYEVKTDYQVVVSTLAGALKRFATGTYLVWYPLLQRPEARRLPEQLRRLGMENWLQVELTVRRPARDGSGMHGSGLFVVNPPWSLPERLKEALPEMVKALALDEGAGFSLDWAIR
ncbi:MAG: 23S rRNA (adenine(2030)-N(6))-methyltransferase RlmJ [Rhodocyclaceae bacterium]|jgi:23S rRNA (adenine2030-N6)-methyltransferase|nr:23S rRNA (adenine(2030)-N(6))-methyltransferase RlmJ [Rhodocyclaceae bacterium]